MSKQAMQTRKLIGNWPLMVILFITALPLVNVEARTNTPPEENCAMSHFRNEISASDAFLVIEPWMLMQADWKESEKIYEADSFVNLESWMLSPEYWEIDMAEMTDINPDLLYGWMFHPAGWGDELAGLSHQEADCDFNALPFYF